MLVLDGQFDANGKAARACLWLALLRDRLELRGGKTARSGVIASARWQPPAPPAELTVRRRLGFVSVMSGGSELLRGKTALKPGGMIAVSSGVVAVSETRYQPVGEAVFADDFMRQPGDPNPWTIVSGEWLVVGIGNEQQSVNGFYFRGSGTKTALATAGEAWWEGYSCSAALRLDGNGAGGLAVLWQANGDYLAFLGDSTAASAPKLRLVWVRSGQETVLAEAAGGFAPGQWYRVAVSVREDKLEAFVDRERVLQGPLPEARGGAVGLLVRGGAARFDDVIIQPSAQPLKSPRNEGSPVADLPVSLGPQDSLTWANPAASWTASPERPSLLWHSGDFPGNVELTLGVEAVAESALRRLVLAPGVGSAEQEWLAVTVRVEPGAEQIAFGLRRPGGPPAEKRVSLKPCGTLSLVRRGDKATVLWKRNVIFSADQCGGLRAVGLEVEGPPVPASSIQVRAPEVRDYVFGVAPTDWLISAGTWEVASRWACDQRWSWFAGWGSGDAAVWNKRPVTGDVTMVYYVGVKMEAPGGPEMVRCRDLNATLCGDMKDPRRGYSFIMGGDGGVKTQLLRNGAVVAECPDIRVPGGYGIHHEWFQVRVARVGHRIEMDFEGRPVIRYDDPDPLPGGYVGLWTRNSGVLVPRVTIYQ